MVSVKCYWKHLKQAMMEALHLNEYERKLVVEGCKWGGHLQVETSGAWNAWLDHPLILAHYQQRGLIDGLSWEAFVRAQLNGPAARSLDIGCGTGSRSLAVYEAGASAYVEGIDISADRVAAGLQQLRACGVPGRFWVEDVNQVRLPAETYDLIFSCHSFHHFLKLEHVMEQVHKALTRRGLFVLEEYVGPTQFQWTDQQMELVRALLALLPEKLRRYRWGMRKDWEGRPTPAEVMAVSPFESIRSAEIVPLFTQHFRVVVMRPLGGTLQHLLYNGIVHNFDPQDPAACRALEAIYCVEDNLIDAGLLPSDFMLLIGQR
jgi:SAM-dependent methyltransferase